MSRRTSRAWTALLTALSCPLLAACQATTRPVSPAQPRSLLFASEVDPSAAESEAFVAQLAGLDAPACRRARLVRAPDLAHELFVRSQSPGLRAEAANSLSDPSYLASEAARAAAPEAHDRLRAALVIWLDERSGDPERIAAGFAELDDSLLQVEASQRARARGAELPALDLAGSSPLQRARAGWLRLVTLAADSQPSPAEAGRVLTQARGLQHLGILDGLDALCAASALLLSSRERSRLASERARIALARRDGTRALRPALAALRSAAPGVARVQARLLLARAQLATGEREAALAEAQSASEEALDSGSRADEARALGLLGAIFLQLGKAQAAASAYGRGAQAARQAGQPELALRAQLNLATALLRAGKLSAAREALAAARHDPLGPDRAELEGQRQVTRALVALVGGELRPIAAAERIDQALEAARAAGCPELVERYATLPARLRGARPSGS